MLALAVQSRNVALGGAHRRWKRSSTTSSDAKVAARARSSLSHAWTRQRAACCALCAATPTPVGQPPGMLAAGGGVVAGAGLEVAVVVAVVAGALEATGAAPGPGWGSFDEQAPRATTKTSAIVPMTTGRGLTTRDSITPEPATVEAPQ